MTTPPANLLENLEAKLLELGHKELFLQQMIPDLQQRIKEAFASHKDTEGFQLETELAAIRHALRELQPYIARLESTLYTLRRKN